MSRIGGTVRALERIAVMRWARDLLGMLRAGTRASSALSLLGLLLLGACAGPKPASVEDLAPVPLPRIEGLEPEIRMQIEAAVAGMEAAREGARTGGADADLAALAEAEATLGLVLLAYDMPEAEPALSNAAALAPQDPRWPYYLGRLHRLAGDAAQAEAAFLRARDLAPEDPVLLLRLAQVRLDAGDLEAAEAATAAALRLAPDLAFGHFLAGQIAAESGDAAAALKHYERALELEPGADRLHYLIALVLRSLGEEDLAAAHMARRGDVPVRLEDPLAARLDALKLGANAALNRGNALLAEGRVEPARDAFATAVAADPKDALARQNLGLALARSGQAEEALEALKAAADLAPGRAEGWRAYGAVLAQSGRSGEAEAAFLRALAVAPEDALSNRSLADLLRREARWEDAAERYRRAIEADPSKAIVMVLRSMCLWRAGMVGQALEVLEMARAGFPEDRDIADALARLLATAPADAGGDPRRALAMAEENESRWKGADTAEALAMAQAAAGDFDAAVATQKLAIERAAAQGREEWRAALEAGGARYAAGEPASEPWPDFIYRQ